VQILLLLEKHTLSLSGRILNRFTRIDLLAVRPNP
jgi:hypothetical protein